MPSLDGLGPWLNSGPLTAESLRGKVVLIDFWTYSCINCIRTLPYVEGYWKKYKDAPFVLVGVHTPEFTFEKDPGNVAMAIKEHGLMYPVAQDNDYGTWNAFDNHYWPAKYLIDAAGEVRYVHFGEGNEEETDAAIASLLKEIGAKTDTGAVAASSAAPREQTPETYVGERGWGALQNAPSSDPTDAVTTYTAPSAPQRDRYALAGRWQLVDGERQVLRGDEGSIAIRALASDVHLVLGLEPGVGPVKADVEVDGKPFQSLTIDRHDLFTLFHGDYGTHDVVLRLHGAGVAAYAYTFGS